MENFLSCGRRIMSFFSFTPSFSGQTKTSLPRKILVVPSWMEECWSPLFWLGEEDRCVLPAVRWLLLWCSHSRVENCRCWSTNLPEENIGYQTVQGNRIDHFSAKKKIKTIFYRSEYESTRYSSVYSLCTAHCFCSIVSNWSAGVLRVGGYKWPDDVPVRRQGLRISRKLSNRTQTKPYKTWGRIIDWSIIENE